MDRLPYLGLAVAVVGVSFSAILIRWSEADALTIAFYRQLFASLMIAPFALRHRDEVTSMDPRSKRLTVVVGAVLAAHFALWTASVQMTTVASAVFLVNIHPILVGTAAFLLWREGGLTTAGGIALGMLGMLTITIGDTGSNLEGNVLATLGGTMTAIYLLMGRRIRLGNGLIGYTSILFSSSAVFLLVMAVAGGATLWPLPMDELALLLTMALVSSIMGHLLYNWCLGYVSASTVSLSFLGEPIGTAILALALLGEVPSMATVAGGALIVVGVLLTVRSEMASPPAFDV